MTVNAPLNVPFTNVHIATTGGANNARFKFQTVRRTFIAACVDVTRIPIVSGHAALSHSTTEFTIRRNVSDCVYATTNAAAKAASAVIGNTRPDSSSSADTYHALNAIS